MPLQPTPPIKKGNLTTVQWEEKLRDFAIMFATRHHHRPAELWYLYTPEAELLMSRTYTKNTEISWSFPSEKNTKQTDTTP